MGLPSTHDRASASARSPARARTMPRYLKLWTNSWFGHWWHRLNTKYGSCLSFISCEVTSPPHLSHVMSSPRYLWVTVYLLSLFIDNYFTSSPIRVRSIVISMYVCLYIYGCCMSVCLLAHLRKTRIWPSRNFLYILGHLWSWIGARKYITYSIVSMQYVMYSRLCRPRHVFTFGE